MPMPQITPRNLPNCSFCNIKKIIYQEYSYKISLKSFANRELSMNISDEQYNTFHY